MTHGGGGTSERDEGGRGGRLALGAPATTEGSGGRGGGWKSATLTILSELGWTRMLARAFCVLRAVDGDHERRGLWRANFFILILFDYFDACVQVI